MRFQSALLLSVLSLSACTAPTSRPNDAASGAVNPTPPSEAPSIPPSATPPTLPDNSDDEAMPPGPVNPR